MLSKDRASPAELAEMQLAGMPVTVQGIHHLIKKHQWDRPEWRNLYWWKRPGKGGGIDLSWKLFFDAAQLDWIKRYTVIDVQAEIAASQAETNRYAAAWEKFNRSSDKKKTEALKKLSMLDEISALVSGGAKKLFACAEIGRVHQVPAKTIYRWLNQVRGISRHHWLAILINDHKGREKKAEFSEAAWRFFCSDYLRPEKPQLSDCYDRLKDVAAEKGWLIPSKATVQRRVTALPHGLVTLLREGRDAVAKLYPAQERDRSVFHALEAVVADGHEWDVRVRWPDGYVGRPMMVAFQDIFSGKILSWRIDRSENKDAVRLAFGDLVEKFGIPSHCYLDNGRAFASKWLTGGIPNRYRFKVREEEPEGLLKILGVIVHWATPYHGQSKPIERAFGTFARSIAKHPAFAGAYTGNNPMNKPSNYDTDKAVDLQTFIDILEVEIPRFNQKPLRDTPVCQGKYSFDDVFDRSYAESVIRKLSPEQRPLWLLAAENISTHKSSGEIKFMENRYWDEFLNEHTGQKLVVRFDPQDLHAGIYVYKTNGILLGFAPAIDKTGYADSEGARTTARARKQLVNGHKQVAEALELLTPQQVASELSKPDAPVPVETKVVRMFTGNAALALQQLPQVAPELLDDEDDDVMRSMRAWRAGNVSTDAVVSGDD